MPNVVFVMLLRARFDETKAVEGLLRLPGQRATAQAVNAMMRDPAQAWTLDGLARVAAGSRATLVLDYERPRV